jgi:hypothetical protein
MAHFAKLDENNVVIHVIVVNNAVIDNLPFPESEPVGVAFCQSLFGSDTTWKQTSYNSNFRGVYASIGYTYDPVNDVFVIPPPPPLPPLIQEIIARVGEPISPVVEPEDLP